MPDPNLDPAYHEERAARLLTDIENAYDRDAMLRPEKRTVTSAWVKTRSARAQAHATLALALRLGSKEA